jgi:hypothetical protein
MRYYVRMIHGASPVGARFWQRSQQTHSHGRDPPEIGEGRDHSAHHQMPQFGRSGPPERGMFSHYVPRKLARGR